MKFLKFPSVVQHEILKQWSLPEKLILALCSFKTKGVVKTLCSRKNCEVWIENVANSDKMIFWIQRGESSERLFELAWISSLWIHGILNSPSKRSFFPFLVSPLNMENRRTAWSKSNLLTIWLSQKYDSNIAMEVLEYLCDLFKAPAEIFLKVNESNLTTNTLKRPIKKSFINVSNVSASELIAFYTKFPSQELSIIDKQISHAYGEACKWNDNIYSIRNLILRERIFEMDKFFFYFKGEHLLCDNSCSFNLIYLKSFVEQWFNNYRFKSKVKSKIIFAAESYSMKTEDVLAYVRCFNVPMEKWDPSKRERYYPYKSQIQNYHTFASDAFDCKDGLDIVRKNDGKRATIKLSPKHFMFFVWD